MEHGTKSKTCEHEPNFNEMYAVLGNYDKQEEIRLANPAVDHCTKLQISADGCDGCEFNPKKDAKPEEVSEDIKEYIPMIENVLGLYDYIEMGLISELSQLTPLEAMLVRSVHNYFRSMKIASAMQPRL